MLLEFGEFTLDLRKRLLLRNGNPVPLQPAPSKLLMLLIQNRHRVVSKEEITDSLWAERVVGPSSITRALSVLRSALDDRAKKRIVTVYGEGYRFAEPVREVDPDALSTGTDPDRVAELERQRQDALLTGGRSSSPEALFELAELYQKAGRLAAARGVLIDLAQGARDVSQRTRFVDAMVAHEFSYQTPQTPEEGGVRSLLLHAAVELTRGHGALHARALACLAAASGSTPLVTRERWVHEALKLADAAAPKLRLEVYVNAHRALETLGTVRQREELMRQAAAFEAAVDDPFLLHLAARRRVVDAFERGSRVALDASIERLESQALARDDARVRSWLASAQCGRAELLGYYDDAMRFRRAALDALRLDVGSDDQSTLAGSLGHMTFRYRMAAGDAVTSLPSVARNHPLFPALAASILCELGRLDQARECLRSCSLQQIREAPRDPRWPLMIAPVAIAAQRLEDRERTLLVRDLLTPHAGSMLCGFFISISSVDHLLGLIHASLGHADASEECFERAATWMGELGARPAEASALFDWAVMLKRIGEAADAPRAEQRFQRAREIARSIGTEHILKERPR